MDTITINTINTSANNLPEYATQGSSGMDVRANIEKSIVLQPLQRFLVPTGLCIEIPIGYEAQMRPRSGLALKNGITCLNSPGTIDADYRGELKVILINLSNEVQTIEHGDRIAQLVFTKVEKVQLNLVQQLNDTIRGDGGFGHTGKK